MPAKTGRWEMTSPAAKRLVIELDDKAGGKVDDVAIAADRMPAGSMSDTDRVRSAVILHRAEDAGRLRSSTWSRKLIHDRSTGSGVVQQDCGPRCSQITSVILRKVPIYKPEQYVNLSRPKRISTPTLATCVGIRQTGQTQAYSDMRRAAERVSRTDSMMLLMRSELPTVCCRAQCRNIEKKRSGALNPGRGGMEMLSRIRRSPEVD